MEWRTRSRRPMRGALFLVLSVLSLSAWALDLAPRRHVLIVGSSTAFPIISIAAEHFGRASPYRAPVLESTGTGGGFKLFCGGVGLDTPDIVMASRPMKPSERRHCTAQGIGKIIELKIGFDGIVVANAKTGPGFDLTSSDLYLALAKHVPDPSGTGDMVPNPYRRWLTGLVAGLLQA